MASLLDRILRVVGRSARDAVTDVVRDELEQRTGTSRKRSSSSRSTSKESISSAGSRSRSTTSGSASASRSNGATERSTSRSGSASGRDSAGRTSPSSTGGHAPVGVYDVASLGLPPFQYQPDTDGDADPGEVVWTWVPYQEDASKGKDRPVLVLSRQGGELVVAQLTSKDHDVDAEQEARWGRYWHDVGTGAWDRQGRPSEVRLDRLLLVDPAAVRREGATMDRSTFNGVVAALREHWS